MTTTLDQAVADATQNPKARVFYSKLGGLCLTRRPQIDQPTSMGQWTTVQEPVRYRFEQGVLTVYEGEDVMRDGNKWLRRGEDQTKERDAVEALKAHYSYGVDFHLEGEEAGRPQPIERDFLRDLARATGRLDVATVESLLEQERATHKRTDLLVAAETSLQTVREELKAIETAKAEAAAQVPAKTPAAKSAAKPKE
jgi:hypothetical protein